MLPLAAVDMFAVGPDVFVKVSPQGSSGGAQHLTFTGVTPGGAGALVGSGAVPSSGPTLALLAGGAVPAGDHYYVYTWVSAVGETIASPQVRIVLTGTAPVAVAPTVAVAAGPGLPAGTYTYGVTHVTASGRDRRRGQRGRRVRAGDAHHHVSANRRVRHGDTGNQYRRPARLGGIPVRVSVDDGDLAQRDWPHVSG